MFPSCICARSHYQVLGVAADASRAQIKESFYRLSKTHHPDVNPANREQAAQKMQEISEAYSVLSDEQQRRKYDASLTKYVHADTHHPYHRPSQSHSMNIHRHQTATYAWKNTRPHKHNESSAYRRKDMPPGFMDASSSSSSSFVHEAQRQARRAALHAERNRRNHSGIYDDNDNPEKGDSWSATSRFLMVVSILGFVQFFRVVFT